MTLRLGSVPVFVSDQDRALAFYRDQMGFKVVTDIPTDSGPRWLTVAPQGGETELILFHPSLAADQATKIRTRVGQWTGIIVLTADIQKAYQTLHNRGVGFAGEPRK